MEWTVLITLLVLGMILIVVEIVFIPGTTVVGILGFVCLIGGIYSAFASFGERTGNIVMISSGVFLIASVVYIFKAKTWEKMALNKTIDSRVNENDMSNLSIDSVAIAVSDLRPMGTIEFENEQFEAETNGEFIEAKSSVNIISIKSNEIIVEKIKDI